jgi:hypothetical protein
VIASGKFLGPWTTAIKMLSIPRLRSSLTRRRRAADLFGVNFPFCRYW